jgi:hypothetical protein
MSTSRRSRALLIAGLAAMILGAIDPLEGSPVIVLGAALVMSAAYLGKSRYTAFLTESFVLVLVGVATMFILSAFGGVGGSSGRSYWWAVPVLTYPVGWLMAIIGAIRRLREPPAVA